MAKKIALDNNFLKTVYNHIEEAVIVADSNKIITYLNPAAEKSIGLYFTLEKGKSTLSDILIYEKSSDKNLLQILTTTTKKENIINTVLSPIKTNNNKFISYDLTINLVASDKNKPHYYIVTFKEFSNTKVLKKQLEESELKYKGLFENAIEGIFIMDSKGTIVDFNPSVCKIYGRNDFYGKSIFDLFPHNTDTQNKSTWKNFLKSGTLNGFYKYIMPNGEVSYIDFKTRSNYLPNLNLAVLSNETKKRAAEIALSKSESNLKAIFDNNEQAIVLLDTKFKILAANASAIQKSSQLLGKDLHIGDSILNYIVNKKLFTTEYNKAKAGSKIVVERNIVSLNGEDNWFEFTYVPIKDGKGNVTNINYVAENINKRKREALELAESEQKFRSLAENSPDIIYILDLTKRVVTYFNKATVLGYSSEYLTSSDSWIEIVFPDDYNRVIEHWSKFLKSKTNKTESIEYRIRSMQGQYEWVSNRHLVMEKDSNGNPSKVLLILTIITDRIKYQEALEESQRRLKALIDNTSDLVWSIDNEFNLTAVNTAFKELIFNNYKKRIKLGDNLYTILPNLTQDGWIALHVTALKGKRVTAEFAWQTKKKENFNYEISYNPIYDTYNNVSGVSVFARDITQRKINEATIVQTNFELDSFVYRASHDLRAPLRSILGLVNIINNQADESDKLNYLRLIEKSAYKLDNFISDLINFSRNSRATLDIEEVEFAAIIEECLENIRFMDGADQVVFQSKIKGVKSFYSDPKRISIFMNNLLSNAVKYKSLSRKSFVKILINVSKTHAVITIEDNGLGIKKEYQQKIFNMFFRASESSYGSGLGLYIARQAVERTGGEIKVESKLGVGTKFIITLPNIEDKMFDFTSM